MFKKLIISFIIFNFIYFFLSFKIIETKKEENLKSLNLEVNKELLDLNFKVQLIFNSIHQIENTIEFKEYLEDQDSHYKIYKLYIKLKDLWLIFKASSIKDSIGIGFYNSHNNYLVHSFDHSITKDYFEKYNISIDKVLTKGLTHLLIKDTLFIFKQNDKNDNFWFLSLDLKKNLPLLYKNKFNLKYFDSDHREILSSGTLSKDAKMFSSNSLGLVRYEAKKYFNSKDKIILSFLSLIYLLVVFFFFLLHKMIQKIMFNRLKKNLGYTDYSFLEVDDITNDITRIISEKNNIENKFDKYNSLYNSLLIKEYLIGLNVNLLDIKNYLDLFNTKIRIIVSPPLSFKGEDEVYNTIFSNKNDSIVLKSIGNKEVYLIKEHLYKKFIDKLIKLQPSIYISAPYQNISKIKGEWKTLNNEYNKSCFKKDSTSSIKDQEEFEKKNKMINFIKNNFQKDISLIDLSELIDETPKYTSYLFKTHTGVNFKNALTTYRIERAKEIMIENPKLKFNAIAEMVGYNSLTSFSNSFKREEKISPSLWRNRSKIEN